MLLMFPAPIQGHPLYQSTCSLPVPDLFCCHLLKHFAPATAVYLFCITKIWKLRLKRTRSCCGSDHELLITKFRLKLKKVGKSTRPFSYDLNQIPFDYTVEVTNRFKGLDLIECLKNYGQRFMTLYRRQESRPYKGQKKKVKMDV